MKATKNIYNYFFARITCFIFWLVTCPSILGQASQKKILTPEDYKLWSSISADQLSNNANWTSYRLQYKYTDTDTLFVQNTSDQRKKIIFPYAVKGKFNGETHFACVAKNVFQLVNLSTQQHFEIAGVERFEFSADQRFVILIIKMPDNKKGLQIRNTDGKLLSEIPNVGRYCFDPKLTGIAYSTADQNTFSCEVLMFSQLLSRKRLAENNTATYQNIIWKEDAIAFIQNNKDAPVLFNYDLKRKKLQSLKSSDINAAGITMTISNSENTNPLHSTDGSKLFFWLKEPQNEDKRMKENDVEIRNSKDRLLLDFHKFSTYYTLSDKMAVWDLNKNTIRQITNKVLPKAFLSPDYQYAFPYDPAAYEPQAMQSCPYDLYALDLKSGEKNLIFKNHYPGSTLSASPDGTSLCYAKDGQWWIFDIHKKKHTCITAKIPAAFLDEEADRPKSDIYYGLGGWTKKGQIILYDKFDLWLISMDGKSARKLTPGRENQKTFRIKHLDTEVTYGDVEFKKYIIDTVKGMLLSTENKETGKAGFSYWKPKSGVKELVWTDKKISQISKAKNKEVYQYLDQNFTSPPRLMVYESNSREILQTNKQQLHYYWGRNERIEYTVNNRKVKGVLFYPANFHKDQHYPMVVSVYERQSHKLNDYENPSLFSDDGFNTPNFTLHDYFVLYPDIVYEFGNLRESVTKSVLTAVDSVLQKGNVKPDKIGLIGHSFGGYESDLIITQTDRFAAAVAGAAWTDLVSTYLYIGPLFRKPNFFRTENHQLRIGKSLYEDMPAYLNNSPVLLAENIKTPLLGWAGEEDRQIHSFQSKEFYLALRRLNKEHTLLIYPNEEHQISSRKNALDLSIRIMQWFDHYLKDAPQQDWMKADYNR